MFNIHNTTAYIRIICFICWFVWFNLVLVCLFAVVVDGEARTCESCRCFVFHLKFFFRRNICMYYTPSTTAHYILLERTIDCFGSNENAKHFLHIDTRYLLNHRKLISGITTVCAYQQTDSHIIKNYR